MRCVQIEKEQLMRIQRRQFLGLTAAIAAAPALRWAGIAAQEATPAPAPSRDELMKMYGPVKGNSAYKLAFMQVFPDNPFWVTLKDAVVARAAENGVTVDVFALPTTGTITDQVSQMEDVVTQKYEGVILGTIDAAGIVPGIEAANNAGIPVIAIDTLPAGGEIIGIVQTDNVTAAAKGGDLIAEAIGGKGKVLNLQGDLANLNGQLRNEGLHKALEPYPDIQIIDQNTHWLDTEALTITENILTSDPDLAAVFAANDPPALAALQVLTTAGKNIPIVGFDGTDPGLQAVKAGV